MNLDQFHHGIRAAREVLRHQGASGALVIMGSQSILASYSAVVLDSALMMSAEVDILPIAADRDEINRLSDHCQPDQYYTHEYSNRPIGKSSNPRRN